MRTQLRTSFVSLGRIASLGVLAAGLIAVTAGSAYGTEQAGRAPVPPALVPPAGNVLSATFAATGVQVYQCTNGAWAFLEPAASLSRHPFGRPAVIHFRGPSWESIDDGSLVEAKAIASVPVTGSIPQLLLQATKNRGDGVFGSVTYIQRLATKGGVAPTGSCTDGQTKGVPYKAKYRFFVKAAA